MTIEIGFLVFPDVQMLDVTGPLDLMSSLEGARCHLVAPTLEPLRCSNGFSLVPTATFSTCPALDVLCVPGGIGVDGAMQDATTLRWVIASAKSAKYITSVCTGALLLGVAGLLQGKRATTHWAFHSLLPSLGAIPVKERVVRDGNTITGGGVTAGIDFGLTLAAELVGEHKAMAAQLKIEYAPAAPFNAGSPETAPPEVSGPVIEAQKPNVERRMRSIAAGLQVAQTLQAGNKKGD